MRLKALILGAATAGALTVALAASSASAATIVHVGTYPPSNPHFFITAGTPTSSVITADFGATISGASTPFDDIFEFTIPQDGMGSGSLSTSFSSKKNKLTITDVLINSVSYALTSTSSGQSLTVNGIPIHNGVLNMIEVKGFTSPNNIAATFDGTATFSAAAVPEPATWIMTIGGFGLIGAAMRRRRAQSAFA
jgi:hypothetical protein